jgi:ACS family tartrate transporter-like MFS transporter
MANYDAVNEQLMAKQMVSEDALMNRLRWRLIPWPMFLFLWTLVDRVNIGYAALSMNKDLGISMTWFGTIAGIFYIAYFLFEIPSNVILHRVGARKWIARIVITWGLVTLLTGFVRGVTDLAICRFLLGAMEAGFYPGLVLYFTYWFPSKHQARAVSLLMVGSSFALVVGGPIATYILTHSQWLGYAGWRWIFFAEGAITVVAGIITFFIMVDRPRNATFLSEDEKQWLDERLKAELVAKSKVMTVSKWGVMKNGWIWYFTLCYFGCIIGLTLCYFWMPQILKRLSATLTNTQIGWISSIPYVCATIAMVAIARHSDKKMERRWHAALSLTATVFALIGLTFSHNLVLSVILLCLAAAGPYTYMVVFWALPSTVLGEATAAVGIAMINSVGNLGGLLGPYLYGFLGDLTHSTTAGTYIVAAFVLMTCIMTVFIPKRYENAAKR